MKLRDWGFSSLVGLQDNGAQAALKYVRETDFGANEFLFMNLMEAHSPYNPPKNYNHTNVQSSPNIEGTGSWIAEARSAAQ